MKRTRARARKRTVVLCRFGGCEDDATTTVGATALCALHATYVLELLDHRGLPGANSELAESLEWWLAEEPGNRKSRR